MAESQLLNLQNAKLLRQSCKAFVRRTAAYRCNSPGDARDGAYRFKAE